MKIFRILRHIIIVLLIFLAVSAAGTYLWVQDQYVVPIMMLHSVDYQEHHLEESANVLKPEYFRFYLKFLKDHKYNVIGFPELIDGLQSGRIFPHNTVVITLDDGYVDNYVYAFPLLQEFGFKAAFFVSSDLVGKEGFMTWAQIKELQEAGMTIGSHSRTHAYLPDVDPQRQWDEIVNSKSEIEKELGVRVEYFSYPVGGFTDEVKAMVRKAGYKAAMTTNRGEDKSNTDLYELKRIRFTKDKPQAVVFASQISGYYNLFRKARPSH